ncbi:MAG: DUF2997 domain-containing protein [Cyanobacteria bacterium P01_E01_bin.42]
MNMETLEFIIYPDGRVQEKVTGIVGRSCTEVTAAIEEQLGRVMSVEKTSDYYALEQNLSNPETNSQKTWTDW